MGEYVSGGYFLTRLVQMTKWMASGLVPERVVTLSSCLTAVVPRGWYLNEPPEPRNLGTALKLGVPEDRLSGVYPWMAAHPPDPPDVWPYAFTTLERAREFAREFLTAATEARLIGAALHRSLVDRFLALAADEQGRTNVSEHTEAVKLGRSPASGGRVLGFEVMGDNVKEDHSLLCTGGEKDIATAFGIRLNAHGLIDTFADAVRAAEWSSGEGHAEPCDYLPWRLDEYDW